MKKLLPVLFFLICMFGISLSIAQEYQVPQKVKLEKPEDYAVYEPDILRCIDYLESSSLDQSDLRKEASAFLVTWLSGCPNVSVEIQPYVLELISKNNGFLTIFMGGWTKYALQNPGDKDKLQGHLAGLRAIIRVYKNGKGVHEDSAVDEIVEADKNASLQEWIQNKLGTSDSTH